MKSLDIRFDSLMNKFTILHTFFVFFQPENDSSRRLLNVVDLLSLFGSSPHLLDPLLDILS